MIWQDPVIGACELVVAVGVFSAMADDRARVPLCESAPTATAFLGLAVAFGTMGMWVACAGAVVGCAVWSAMAADRRA